MYAFSKMIWVDLKLFSRNWMASFFTLAFPLLMLFVFGSLYGNQPSSFFGGFGAIDVTVPGYIAALIIGTTGFISLPLDLTNRREQSILRRFRAAPVSPTLILGSQLVINLLTAVFGAGLLTLSGVLFYNLRLPANPLPVILGFLAGCVSMFSISFLLASVFRTVSAARAVCMALFYPMMFLSGGTFPREVMPAAMQHISDFIPLTYTVDLLKSLWFGHGWDLTALAVLAALFVIGLLVSVRLFRWE